jgi:hypothetical protein
MLTAQPVFIIIKLLGASSKPLLYVAAVDKRTTLLCEPRLDQGMLEDLKVNYLFAGLIISVYRLYP